MSEAGPKRNQPETHTLLGDDRFPNNEDLPLLVYPPEMTGASSPEDFESMFEEHGWTGSWRNGVYPYHHYHSVAHEVLGCYAGSAVVRLGGEDGITVEFVTGAVVVIPAGVAHKRLSSSDDFAVVGAYPNGQRPDMCYGESEERPDADERIAEVEIPEQDPVLGRSGPLVSIWSG